MNFQESFDFIRKVKITKYDFVKSYDFVIYHNGTLSVANSAFEEIQLPTLMLQISIYIIQLLGSAIQ